MSEDMSEEDVRRYVRQGCQKRMSAICQTRMPKDMSEEMSIQVSEKNVRRYVRKNARRYARKGCQKICQKRMSEKMSKNMSEKMLEDMSEKDVRRYVRRCVRRTVTYRTARIALRGKGRRYNVRRREDKSISTPNEFQM